MASLENGPQRVGTEPLIALASSYLVERGRRHADLLSTVIAGSSTCLRVCSVASYNTMYNRNARATAILLLLLVVGYVLPAICVPVLAASTAAGHGPHMPCDCHRDKHTPIPTQNCCYTTHQLPAAIQVACPHGPSFSVTYHRSNVSSLGNSRAGCTAIAKGSEFSPPAVSVLRI